jgi:ABC-type microcin C transport system duplicated ATPase subunit YejF
VTDAILSARSLSKSFGGQRATVLGAGVPKLTALDDVSIDIIRGKTLGIVGESGSGKTTLGRLLLLLDQPSSGEVRFERRAAGTLDAAGRREFRRRVQPVFQNPYSSLNPRMTVGAIISEPLFWSGSTTREERRIRITGALTSVGLSPDDARRFPGEFSGGQRQRIAIARAIASQPDVIILDEPVSSQDISVRAQILNMLKDIQEQRGIAYLLITHDLSTLSFMCDEVAVLHQGKVVEHGPAAQVCSAPKHSYTASLLSSALSIDAA